MTIKNPLQNLSFKDPAVFLATWMGCGLLRPAPGTWGTLSALSFGIFMQVFGGWPAVAIAVVLVTHAGLWAIEEFQKITKTHDSSIIVIDEVAGMWLTLALTMPTGASVLVAFLLFRFFDIVKIWPVSWFDKSVKGAKGVMLDDLAAAVYAALAFWGLQYAGII